MVWTLKNLVEHAEQMQVYMDGYWVPARPLAGPLICRIRAAWRVLKGEADAFIWPAGQ